MTSSPATRSQPSATDAPRQLQRTSHCPLDCPDQCSLTVTLEETATETRVTKVTGSDLNPFTKGIICSKVRAFGDRVHSPERLTTPMVRKAGSSKGMAAEFEPLSWPAAIERIAAEMQRVQSDHGGEAILPVSYGGSNGALTEGMIDERLWRRIGASRLDRTLCASSSGAAFAGQLGKMPGTDLRDYAHSNLIVIWGQNPKDSGMHLVPTIKEAQKRGAKLVVIDPRSTGLARSADLHLAIHPGTDLCLALAIHRIFFERDWQDDKFLAEHTTGADKLRAACDAWTTEKAAAETRLSAADIERLATLLHESTPAVIRGGWGPERSRNGGSALAAIYAIAAVAGLYGVRGGGMTASLSRALPISKDKTVGAQQDSTLRKVSLNQVGRALCGDADVLDSGPVPALAFIYNCNAVSTLPNRNAVIKGLQREDLFTVVFEQVQTDTTYYADIILPATTFFEHDELVSGYGATFLAHARAVMDPLAGARPNSAVFHDLIVALGLAEPGDIITEDDLAKSILTETNLSPAQREELAKSGGTVPAFELENGRPPMPFVDHFPLTPDQKMHLFPAELDAEAKERAAETGAEGGLYIYQPDPATSAFPLAMISPAMGRMTTSTFGESYDGPAPLYLNAVDANARGIQDGDGVRVFNQLGEVHTIAQVGGRDQPAAGTVVLLKGLWERHTANGSSSNSLSPDHLSDLGGNACFNDARVEVTSRA